ncbi:MAG: sugar ABC transporter substrate-binding protein [Alicyclobacillaceae bacterium]|nr:sugar ABC transporter substrate-binding protein [Alicyclobacillaceae bacterium]
MKNKVMSGAALLSAAALSLGVIGCAPNQPKSAPSANLGAAKTTAAGNFKIGYLHFSYTIPQVQAIIGAADKEAKKVGITVMEEDGQGSAQKQATDALNFLVQHVNALLVEPVSPSGIVPVIKKYHDAGVPVIGVTLPVAKEGQKYLTSFVGPDNVAGGIDAAKLMKQALGKKGGTVAVIEGAPGTVTTIDRTNGFVQGLKGSNVKIVAMQASPWDRTKAMNIMQDFLSKYPHLNGVFAESDDMAMGAIQAIKQAGKTGQIVVIGHDGSKEAVQAIKDGTMYGTVTEPLLWEGKTAIDVAYKVLHHQPVKKWYKTPVTLLTKKNVNGYTGAF